MFPLYLLIAIAHGDSTLLKITPPCERALEILDGIPRDGYENDPSVRPKAIIYDAILPYARETRAPAMAERPFEGEEGAYDGVVGPLEGRNSHRITVRVTDDALGAEQTFRHAKIWWNSRSALLPPPSQQDTPLGRLRGDELRQYFLELETILNNGSPSFYTEARFLRTGEFDGNLTRAEKVYVIDLFEEFQRLHEADGLGIPTKRNDPRFETDPHFQIPLEAMAKVEKATGRPHGLWPEWQLLRAFEKSGPNGMCYGNSACVLGVSLPLGLSPAHAYIAYGMRKGTKYVHTLPVIAHPAFEQELPLETMPDSSGELFRALRTQRDTHWPGYWHRKLGRNWGQDRIFLIPERHHHLDLNQLANHPISSELPTTKVALPTD